MNILQRKMFSNGDVANTSVSEPLIRYYVSQGYNPAEIKDAYPAAPYGLIEQIAMEFGGVVNPGVQGRNSRGMVMLAPEAATQGEFGNLLNQVPMGETIVTGSPTGELSLSQAEAPQPNTGIPVGVTSPDEISAIAQKIEDLLAEKRRIKEKSVFQIFNRDKIPLYLDEIDQQIASLKNQLQTKIQQPSAINSSPNLGVEPEVLFPELPTEQEITGVSPGVSSEVSLSELPTEQEITGVSSAAGLSDSTLTVRDKSTLDPETGLYKEYKLPANFQELIDNKSIDGLTLYPIINNTNFEFSPDVKAALENFVEIDSTFNKLQNPFGLSFDERRGSFLFGPKDIGSAGQNIVKTAGELLQYPLTGLYGLAGEFMGGGRGRQEKLSEVPDISISDQNLALERLLQIPGVLGTTLISTDPTTDQNVDDTDKAIKELQEAAPNGVVTEEAVTEEAAPEAEEAATEEATGGVDFSKYAPDLQERLDAELSDTSKITGQPTEQEQENINRIITNQGSFFSSPDWNEFLRNLGIGLSESSDLASGLVRGTALGSQAKALREAEALKAEQEERLELIKAGKADKLGIEDFEKIATRDENLAEQLRNFQKSAKNLKYIDEITGIIDGGGATGLSGFTRSWITKAVGLLGGGANLKDWDNLDPTTRARALLKVMQQTNIREILGESGRTISNLDRDIIKDVFGDIKLTTTPAEILRKLEDSREGVMMSANETKGLVNTNLGFFKRAKINSSVAEQNRDLIKMIIQFDTNTYGSDYAKAYEEVDIDYRKQFKSSS